MIQGLGLELVSYLENRNKFIFKVLLELNREEMYMDVKH